MYRIKGADGKEYGPVTAEQLREWFSQGRANANTLVKAEGEMDWKTLSTFSEFSAMVAPSIAPPVQRPASDRASNKVAAGILGIILGGFGIHKFILGYTGAGLIMLLVSVLSCGIAYVVMHVIGLIEGIIYLTKSDEDFVRIYVDGRKEWF
jgi:TM2 domain-containing membrane protein YozV